MDAQLSGLEVNVQILDIRGKRCWSNEFKSPGDVKLELKGLLENGLYIILVKGRNFTAQKRLLINNAK